MKIRVGLILGREMIVELDEYCPCCGYNTFVKSERLHIAICSICFWVDDPVEFEDPNHEGGANEVSLIQARKNFGLFGSCQRGMLRNCRKPEKSDKRKIDW